MTLSLTTPEQHALADAIRTLASPAAPASGWLVAALDAVEAVGRSASIYVAPPALSNHCEGFDLGSLTLPTDRLSAYERHFPYLVQTGAFCRSVRGRVVSRRQAYGDRYDEIVRSEYTRVFLRSVLSFDAVTMTVPLVTRPLTHRDVVQLAFVSRDPTRHLGDRHVSLAWLLYPAFETGIGTLRRLAAARSHLRTALDATGTACWVADRDGRCCHQTPALGALFSGVPDRTEVLALAARLGHTFWGDAPTVRAEFGGRYRLTATELRDGHEVFVVVRVERCADPGGLNETHLGLTPRQTQVASLLAERQTNREIAAALGVSVHTVRHHVEAVLSALAVPRREVGRVLWAAAADRTSGT